MTAITKAELEKTLLRGLSFSWTDGTGKKSLHLGKPEQRRLFNFLLSSNVREATNLSTAFVSDLHAAFDASDDPASAAKASVSSSISKNSWRLHSIETEGFGGLNIWNGGAFSFIFDGHSYLLEGPNGSGKSSLTGAIIWALTGERPRDQAPSDPHAPRPVLGNANDKPIGEWPPLATYPPTSAQLATKPAVRVTLKFADGNSQIAAIERRLVGAEVQYDWDPRIDTPSVLLETGLLMPARLSTLRFDDGSDTLTGAVQKLTGLDDLAAIGLLCEGLCHASREYRSHLKKELAAARRDFDSAVDRARVALNPVSVNVDAFTPADTADKQGPMAKFGENLATKAQELTAVVKTDLAPSLDVGQATVQTRVAAAIENARAALSKGLPELKSWQTLTAITSHLSEAPYLALRKAITSAQTAWGEARTLRARALSDSRFQLKALAAQWHAKHQHGPIVNCPLCEHDLTTIPELATELSGLKDAGEAASRSYEDSLNRIVASITTAVPDQLRRYTVDLLEWEPRSQITGELQKTLGSTSSFAQSLKTFSSLVDHELTLAPDESLPLSPTITVAEEDQSLAKAIATAERLLLAHDWHAANEKQWTQWWKVACEGESPNAVDATPPAETSPPATDSNAATREALNRHIRRLSVAMTSAEPYRVAAAAMRDAWASGVQVRKMEVETKKREAVAEALTPLKSLGSLSTTIASDAIQRLSERIGSLLQDIHISEQLKYSDAKLLRKEGLVVHAGFDPDLRINATLVANTSWLRAVLWAFIFSLREEAVRLDGHDAFPFLLFDDPQATFDFAHRHRWAGYIASLQTGASNVQVILTSYDETFLRLIKISGVTGRDALIVSAGKEFKHIAILEGEHLDRLWTTTQTVNTPAAGREFINAARIYVEGMLKLMLRGEITTPDTYVLGSCREKLSHLHKNGNGTAPWNRSEFSALVATLDKSKSQIAHLEISHHAGSAQLAMAEATDVRAHLVKHLLPALNSSFRLVRQNLSLHAGQKSLHKSAPIVQFPEGYKDEVRKLPFQIWGLAAALTDGLAADGMVDLSEYDEHALKKITLAQHVAYILNANTLDPVAKPGDMLLVLELDGHSDPALVVAIDHDCILARRYVPASHDSDIAVLSAQATNPYDLSEPIVAHRATVVMRKIVGVIYKQSHLQGLDSNSEIIACAGDAPFTALASSTLGLVEVVGRSAEPFALNGQYLVVQKPVSTLSSLKQQDGKPVIAIDSDGARYFKRLRIGSDRIILESLATDGAFGPVVLHFPGSPERSVASVWPVLGVLFEIPGQK